MKDFLIITEKNTTQSDLKDGGYSLLKTLKRSLPNYDIMSFNFKGDENEFTYPIYESNKFERRLKNANFIQSKICEVAENYKTIIFIHISMCFGFSKKPSDVEFVLFPMFLTPSYKFSGHVIPEQYKLLESKVLQLCDRIFTPSMYEMSQLTDLYIVTRDKIVIVPRGVPNFNQKKTIRKSTSKKHIIFCSLASIKPQKNTLDLIHLFKKIAINHDCCLKIIGAIQNEKYYEKVLDSINEYNLRDRIVFTGYISHKNIPTELNDAHFHLVTSKCETFGRSIYETLSMGIPNICLRNNNASFDYLSDYPFISYLDDFSSILDIVETMISNYSILSELSIKIIDQFNDDLLGDLLASKLMKENSVIIADYDGTIYDKNDELKTLQNVSIFNKYPLRIICSSRSTSFLKEEITRLNIKADYIIAYSGAVITNGNFEELSVHQIKNNIIKLKPIFYNGKIVQYEGNPKEILSWRVEKYSDKSFTSKLETSKLSSIIKLLKIINWRGDVVAFGDSKYDYEFLRFFDGYLIETNKDNNNKFKLVNEIL